MSGRRAGLVGALSLAPLHGVHRSNAVSSPFPRVIRPTSHETGSSNAFAESLSYNHERADDVKVGLVNLRLGELSQQLGHDVAFGLAPFVLGSSAGHIDPARRSLWSNMATLGVTLMFIPDFPLWKMCHT
jgi:hypothetical protein